MPNKTRVAVLFGGRSAEHEISILSARNVLAALDRDRFDPVLIGIDREGRWSLQDEARLIESASDPRRVGLDGSAPDVQLPRAGAAALQIAGAADAPIDVVFPVLHGPMGEDGTVQGLLEVAGLPFVGAGVVGSSVGMDKDVMKRLLQQANLPIVPHATLRRADYDADPEAALDRCGALGFPVFAKPANLGSSVGISRATDRATLQRAIADAFAYDRKVIVERGIDGVREIECGVLGNDHPIASIPGEIAVDHPDGFYSYTAKYVDETGAEITIPAPLDAASTDEVRRLAIATFRALECEGLARVDLFLAPDGALYINEINTLPGFTAISMFPMLWRESGLPPTALVTRLIELALERAEARRALATTQG